MTVTWHEFGETDRKLPEGFNGVIVDDHTTGSIGSDMMLVSVVIPCYNQAHYLGEAIESVLRQTYSCVEVIVVDDGSIDNTSEVAAKYPDVRCIRQENQGLSAARNTGLRESQGAFLVFLDADDRLLPNALEAGLQQLQANPECAFVSGHFRYINGDGSFRNEYLQEAIDPDHYLAFLQGNHIGMHATVMYRRAVFEAVGGFNTALPACEDYDLYLRIARQFPVARYNQVVAEYRQHHTNMSVDAGLMLKTVLAVLQSQMPAIETNPQQKKVYMTGIRFWQQFYGEELFRQAIGLWASGQLKQALQKLITLMRFAPRYFVQYLYWQATQVGWRILSAILPVAIYRILVHWRGQAYYPPVGAASFGDLRRLTPISREYGFDRGLPIDRYYIENFLANYATDIHGRVLEIEDNTYTRRFGDHRVTSSDVLHVIEGNPKATIVADITHAEHIASNSFDCIIFTQTLQYIYDIKLALQTLYRTLKPGGVVLATVPGVSQISIDEWSDSWHWMFTELVIRRLFGETFGEENITVKTHGNVLAATAFLNGLAAEELHQAELEYYDPHYQLLITVRAVKPN